MVFPSVSFFCDLYFIGTKSHLVVLMGHQVLGLEVSLKHRPEGCNPVQLTPLAKLQGVIS